MKVLSTEGLTKLIDLIKNNFISSSDTQATVAVDAVETTAVDAVETNVATLATVATTGSYNDLSGKPTVDQTYDGTSANAQSGVAVASAISGKADDNAVVHLAGTETITGEKTFSTAAYGTASDALNSIVTTVNKLKQSNGYFQLGNGLIVQWGVNILPANATSLAVTFPKAFSDAWTHTVIVQHNGSASAIGVSTTSGQSSTGFTCHYASTYTADRYFCWLAIGY